MNVLLVFCTFPDADTARQIGTMLVESQLAACVNVIPGIESIYRWEGSVQHDAEVIALLKTTADNFPRLEARLLDTHPYDTPEIISVRPESVDGSYADWIRASCR